MFLAHYYLWPEEPKHCCCIMNIYDQMRDKLRTKTLDVNLFLSHDLPNFSGSFNFKCIRPKPWQLFNKYEAKKNYTRIFKEALKLSTWVPIMVIEFECMWLKKQIKLNLTFSFHNLNFTGSFKHETQTWLIHCEAVKAHD